MSSTSPAPLIVKIGIATMGRRAVLSNALTLLGSQARLPNEVIVCPANADDCDEAHLATLPYPARTVCGNRGSSGQRNAIIDQCGACDVMVFFDDDFYASSDYLERLERMFLRHANVVGLTGKVLVDGAITAGVEHAEALAILDGRAPCPVDLNPIEDVYSLYGCNMAVRMEPVRAHKVYLDENLPLYGWLEDVDFTRRLAAYGRLVKSDALTGVHLATKRGRSSGIRIGYSQIANPWYLMHKGTMAPTLAMQQLARNVAKNAYRSFMPEPWVDRRGRLHGNALAALDLLRGRLHPRNIMELRQD